MHTWHWKDWGTVIYSPEKLSLTCYNIHELTTISQRRAQQSCEKFFEGSITGNTYTSQLIEPRVENTQFDIENLYAFGRWEKFKVEGGTVWTGAKRQGVRCGV